MPDPRQVERLLNRSFEIVQTGALTLASPNSAGSSSNTSVPYAFDFKPIIFAFVSYSSGGTRFILPNLQIDNLGGADVGKIRGEVAYEVVDDIITFYFRNFTAALNQTAYIRYYVCRDPAS